MIHVVLSDFTSDEPARLKRAREEAFESEMAQFRELDIKRQADAAELRRQYDDAWTAGRYLFAVVLWFRILFAPGPESPPLPKMAAVTAAERILESGDAGQRAVIEQLASRLDDRWIALSGYFNRRGEVDIVLIGPGGIGCIEVKTLNAEVTVDGDVWSRQFRGRHGQAIGTPGLVLDKGGRSPSRQLNEPAEHLRLWLQRHGVAMQLQRWVVLAHANSRVGQVRNLMVDAVMRTEELDVDRLMGATRPAHFGSQEIAHVTDRARSPASHSDPIAQVHRPAWIGRRRAHRAQHESEVRSP